MILRNSVPIYYGWILIGNIKTFIDLPQYGDHLYQFTEMIYANDKFAYLRAAPSITGRYGGDIIRIEDGVDTLQYISSLTCKNEGEQFDMLVNAFYEDGYIIFGGWAKIDGVKSDQSNKFYCFKAEDLGITFPTSDVTENTIKKTLKISPNPTTSFFTVYSEETGHKNVEIIDKLGRLIMKKSIEGCCENPIDISSLSSGMYIVRLVDERGAILGIGKVVKL
ncbi:MAG: T9SS type A sorting domain-containing protein [Saprospiraceae bacterium]